MTLLLVCTCLDNWDRARRGIIDEHAASHTALRRALRSPSTRERDADTFADMCLPGRAANKRYCVCECVAVIRWDQAPCTGKPESSAGCQGRQNTTGEAAAATPRAIPLHPPQDSSRLSASSQR